MDIYVVDFSGAKTGGGTWVARGHIERGALSIREVKPAPEKDPAQRVDNLAQRVRDSTWGSLWSLDFPFSLPEEFVEWLQAPKKPWYTLARFISSMPKGLQEFSESADEYIACRQRHHIEPKEPLRCTDKRSEGAFSALHKVQPNMRPMTYYGICLLEKVVSPGVDIPPIYPCNESRLTIVEIHPRSTLQKIFDRKSQWWGYKGGVKKNTLRKNILERLEQHYLLRLKMDEQDRIKLLKYHDALDSVIACWTGALWLEKRHLFADPEDTPEAKTEGWIWAPLEPSLILP